MATVFPYTYANLKASINARIHNKMGLVPTPRTVINDVVTEVANLQLRSAKKKAALAPNLFNDIYQYAAPTDIDGNNLIGVQPQSMNRDRNNIWELVTEEEFDIRKQTDKNLIAFADHTFIRTLLISSYNGDLRQLTIANLQGLTGDSSSGTSWSAFGNADTLATDNYNFIKGNGSLSFNLTTGGTTAGVVLDSVNTFDLTEYKSSASVFVWAYFTTASYVTNVKLRVGNSASVYYELTATTPNDGTSFVNGWNLIRFDFNSKTTTGTPTDTTCNYVALYITKASGTVDTGYRFNWLNAKQGQISNLIYYSGNPWESNAGTFLAQSTADSDYLVCDQDEYNMFVEKGVEICGLTAREYKDADVAGKRFIKLSTDYKKRFPTESLQLTSTYYYMNSGNKAYSNNISLR